MITVEEVKELAHEFWEIVKSGAHGSAAEYLFINPGLLLPTGEWMDLESHQAMHRALCDESHNWIELDVTPLPSDDLERVLARGTVHWEASLENGKPGRVISDVGETWVIERGEDGKLRWTLYWSSTLALAPESVAFEP